MDTRFVVTVKIEPQIDGNAAVITHVRHLLSPPRVNKSSELIWIILTRLPNF